MWIFSLEYSCSKCSFVFWCSQRSFSEFLTLLELLIFVQGSLWQCWVWESVKDLVLIHIGSSDIPKLCSFGIQSLVILRIECLENPFCCERFQKLNDSPSTCCSCKSLSLNFQKLKIKYDACKYTGMWMNAMSSYVCMCGWACLGRLEKDMSCPALSIPTLFVRDRVSYWKHSLPDRQPGSPSNSPPDTPQPPQGSH